MKTTNETRIANAVEALSEWAALEIAVVNGARVGLLEKQAGLKATRIALQVRPEPTNKVTSWQAAPAPQAELDAREAAERRKADWDAKPIADEEDALGTEPAREPVVWTNRRRWEQMARFWSQPDMLAVLKNHGKYSPIADRLRRAQIAAKRNPKAPAEAL